jgi:hypothetical protein
VRRAHKVAEETAHDLSDAAADAERQREETKREQQEQFEELTLLQTQGSKLWLAIVSPPWVRNHLLERMRITALRHTEMIGELAMLQTTVSSTVEFALGRSPDETFWVKVVDELVAKFRKLHERRSRLERPGVRNCDLLLGPPSVRARLAKRLETTWDRAGCTMGGPADFSCAGSGLDAG